jgi:hypothetical protein
MTEGKPDFEKLRAERNAAIEAHREELAAKGWHIGECSFTDPNECYCDCPDGPCEHTWEGESWELDSAWSVTCSRCSLPAIWHALRTGP